MGVYASNELSDAALSLCCSKDPRFEEKFWDVIGLYLNPPDKALVLCCDAEEPVPGFWSACNLVCRWGWAISAHKRTIITGMGT